MQTQITLEKSQLKSLLQHTHSKDASEAVEKVVENYLSQIKRQQKKLSLLRKDIELADEQIKQGKTLAFTAELLDEIKLEGRKILAENSNLHV